MGRKTFGNSDGGRGEQFERGFSAIELVIILGIVGIVSVFALMQVRSARAQMRLQNSVRQLAAYMERARVDAVRRHGTSSVTFTSPTTYRVTMDFNNGGTPSDRTFSFEQGVQVASADLPSVTFNWRGRTLNSGSSCVTTFSIGNGKDGLSVDVSGSGDVTVESQQPTIPAVEYSTAIAASDGVNSRLVVGGTTEVDNTPCLDLSGGGEEAADGPPGCTIRVSSSSISIKKNGGATGSVLVSMSTPTLVVASFPSNLTVSPGSQTVSTGTSFSIRSNDTLRGPFDVKFTSQCGSSTTVRVNVVN